MLLHGLIVTFVLSVCIELNSTRFQNNRQLSLPDVSGASLSKRYIVDLFVVNYVDKTKNWIKSLRSCFAFFNLPKIYIVNVCSFLIQIFIKKDKRNRKKLAGNHQYVDSSSLSHNNMV